MARLSFEQTKQGEGDETHICEHTLNVYSESMVACDLTHQDDPCELGRLEGGESDKSSQVGLLVRDLGYLRPAAGMKGANRRRNGLSRPHG